MSSSILFLQLIGIITGGVLSQALFAYTAYWAFNIRRALVVRVYRNQALGIGLVALSWILIFFNNIFFGGVLFTEFVAFFAINNLVGLMLFYFIDNAVLAGRRSDPLLRDTLHWQRLRAMLWPLAFVSTGISISLAVYFQLTTGSEPQFMVFVGYLLIYVIEPPSLTALLVTALRSKDPLLRRQLVWFGLFLLMLAFVDFSRVTNLLNGIGIFVGLIVGGYCLYRSARSLAPLNRIPLEKTKAH